MYDNDEAIVNELIRIKDSCPEANCNVLGSVNTGLSAAGGSRVWVHVAAHLGNRAISNAVNPTP